MRSRVTDHRYTVAPVVMIILNYTMLWYVVIVPQLLRVGYCSLYIIILLSTRNIVVAARSRFQTTLRILQLARCMCKLVDNSIAGIRNIIFYKLEILKKI